MKHVFVYIIRLYQKWISPMFPATCRFHPTCSQYGIEAIQTHGAVIGLFLTIKRILKCHPLHPGGYDPIPPKKNHHEEKE